MTSQLPRFWCYFAVGSWKKDTENGAAVTSLRFFLFRDDFSFFTKNRLKDISTLDFSTPSSNPGPFNPGLFNHEFLNHGIEKFMVEKSGAEMSCL